MTSSQLYLNLSGVSLATEQKSVSDIKQNVLQYTASHCYNVKYRPVLLSSLGVTKVIPIRCGKCQYCCDMKSDEWFTRMWHETKANKYCYFVTLKYKPFDTYDEIPDFLRNAYYHYDDFNSTHHLAYHPCLVRIEHVQYFMRFLRRLCGFRIKYFVGMEYGSDYGRPHYHLILWCNEQLTLSNIERAWSYNIGSSRKNPLYLPIGSVDFNDLVVNGTILKDPNDPSLKSAKSTFKYVAKYVNKPDFATLHRVNFLREDILEGVIDNTSPVFYDVFDDVEKFCKLLLLDEYETYKDAGLVSSQKLFQLVRDSAESGLVPFSYLFKSKTSCSRAEGLGACYVSLNIERLAKGRKKITDDLYGTLVCPTYYIRKVSEYLNPILFRSKLAGSSSYSAQNRPQICEDLQRVLNYPFTDPVHNCVLQNVCPGSLDPEAVKAILRSPFSMRNTVTHERMVIIQDVSELTPVVRVLSYRYNVHTRNYDFSGSIRLDEFVETFLDYCKRSFDYSCDLYDNIKRDMDAFSAIKDIIDTFMMNFNQTFNTIQSDCVSELSARRLDRNRKNQNYYSPKIF